MMLRASVLFLLMIVVVVDPTSTSNINILPNELACSLMTGIQQCDTKQVHWVGC